MTFAALPHQILTLTWRRLVLKVARFSKRLPQKPPIYHSAVKSTPLFPPIVLPLIALLACATIVVVPRAAAAQFAGLWRAGSDANYVNYGLDAATLYNLANQYHTNGARLVSLRSYLDNGNRVWAAIWRGGSDAEYYNIDRTWSEFTALYAQRFASGLRLVQIETYLNAGARYWAGLWRSGNDGEVFYAGLSVDALTATNNILGSQNLRLIDVETYVDAGARYWAGLWRSGADDSAFASDLTAGGLAFVNFFRHAQGMEMIDVKSYPDTNGAQLWAAVWRATTNPTTPDLTMDFEKLNAEVGERFAAGQRMFNLSVYDVQCDASCRNTVVAPGAYNYGITRTALHCNNPPGSCPAPPNGSVVWYNWPVDVTPSANYVRLSAVNAPDQFLTLPFIDPQVKFRAGWRYSSGDWHHAVDYSRDDAATFHARAAAPGEVIFVGWDTWSGNTIILSHNRGGPKDNYRTIYMHLRNGAANDCTNAWNLTIPWFATRPDLAADKTNYLALLNATGCTQNPAARNPDPTYWGLDTDKIQVSVGQQVERGQSLGWAGETGPGGNRNKAIVNTHLHVFFAHRDPADGNWYFFDPYGIYALPNCYPPGVTDDLSTDCIRYPIAWQGARPQYPPPFLEYEHVTLGFLGNWLRLSWEGSAARLWTSPNLADGRWAPVSATNNPYFAPFTSTSSFFQLRR